MKFQYAIRRSDPVQEQRDRELEDYLATVASVASDTYAPALTNVAIGTGGSVSNTANYLWVGGTNSGDEGLLHLDGVVVLGTSGASVSGAISVGVPAGFTFVVGVGPRSQTCRLTAAGGNYIGNIVVGSTTTLNINALRASGTYLDTVSTSATIPDTWAAGNSITWGGTFRAVRA